jgi:cobalt-zinc-cadmium efflux system outer membrane protein
VAAFTRVHTQSTALPNPIASYSGENILGNKRWRGWRSAESRYELAQLIELGGKRGYRISAANYLLCAVEAEYEAEQLAVLNDLLKLFIDVATAQEQLDLALEQNQVAEEVFKTVVAKVEDGKVSIIQQHKADIALANAQINLENTNVDFANAKAKLALLWGNACVDFERVDCNFYELEEPWCVEECLSELQFHPELVHAQFEHLGAHQNYHLEKAEAIPDITVVVGYKTLQETHERGLILGASIPLPIFDRNRGNVLQALAIQQKAEDEYKTIQLLLENKLSSAHKEMMRAFQEAARIQSTVLKTAMESFELAQEGYRAGKFEYLDMLDSQRTLFEIRERYIQALTNYHKSRADIEYLTSG